MRRARGKGGLHLLLILFKATSLHSTGHTHTGVGGDAGPGLLTLFKATSLHSTGCMHTQMHVHVLGTLNLHPSLPMEFS